MSYATQGNPHGDNRHGELATSTSAPFARGQRTCARTSTEMRDGRQVTSRGTGTTTDRPRSRSARIVPGLESAARSNGPTAPGAPWRLDAPHHRRTVRRVEGDARGLNRTGGSRGHLAP